MGRLTHGLPDVAQGINELLQLASVSLYVHVALDQQAPKLGLYLGKLNCSVKLMIPELIMDRVPDGVCRSLGATDNGANVLGY